MLRFFFVLSIFMTGLFLTTPARAADSVPWQPPEPAFKVLVDESGIYRLTYEDLATAGLPVDSLDPRTLQLYGQGRELAMLVLGEEDGRFDPQDEALFYGEAADTRYTDVNVYWLTYGRESGKRVGVRASREVGPELTVYPERTRFDENYIYVSNLPLNNNHDHWYGPSIQAAGLNVPKERIITLTLDALEPGSEARFQGLFAGNVTGVHHLRILVNDAEVYDGQWEDRTLHWVDAPIPAHALRSGENQVRLILLNDTPGQLFDMIYIDWVEIAYARQLVARDQQLAFDSPSGAWTYEVHGFNSADLLAFDISDPQTPILITGWRIHSQMDLPFVSFLPWVQPSVRSARIIRDAEASERHTLVFGDGGNAPRRYLILAASQIRSPLHIQADTPSRLADASQGADYILITHRDFWNQAKRLADYRAGQGLRVALVDVQDIYDEFNFGLMSAEAIHDFLAHAYAHWPPPAPQFVLLMGDGTYDMRRYLPDTANTYIPPYLTYVDKFLGEVATDNRYVSVVGEDFLPDMHIGRMPVNTPAEAQRLVDKTIAYETQAASGDWRRRVLFITDDLEGGGGDFYALSDELADGYADPPDNTIKFLPEGYDPIKVYLGLTCDANNPSIADECKRQIVETLEGPGALIMNYIGHATKEYWAAERLMDQATVDHLANEGQWPITLAMACVDGFFHEPRQGARSFAEANVLSQGGSVASWSATSLGLVNPHQLLEKGFFLALFHDRLSTLGEITTAAKWYVDQHAPPGSSRYQEVIDAYTLFGDPALQISLPTP